MSLDFVEGCSGHLDLYNVDPAGSKSWLEEFQFDVFHSCCLMLCACQNREAEIGRSQIGTRLFMLLAAQRNPCKTLRPSTKVTSITSGYRVTSTDGMHVLARCLPSQLVLVTTNHAPCHAFLPSRAVLTYSIE